MAAPLFNSPRTADALRALKSNELFQAVLQDMEKRLEQLHTRLLNCPLDELQIVVGSYRQLYSLLDGFKNPAILPAAGTNVKV